MYLFDVDTHHMSSHHHLSVVACASLDQFCFEQHFHKLYILFVVTLAILLCEMFLYDPLGLFAILQADNLKIECKISFSML